MPKTSTKKNNKGTNAMYTQTNKGASVDTLQLNNNINNKADKSLPCTNSSEHADDMVYSKTAAKAEQSKNKKNYESKTDSKYTFGYSNQKNNEDVDDNEEEEMDACTFEIPIATNKNKMPSSSRTSSLPFDLHGAERLRREFLFSFGRLNQHKRSMRTHTNQGFASNSGSESKFNVNCDMSNDDNDDNTQQHHHVMSKNNEQDDEDEDEDEEEEEDDDEELNEYDDNVRHIAALRGMLTDEELFRAFFEPLSYTFDSGSRDDTEEGYHYTNSNWQRRRMEQNYINDRFHRVEVIDDNEEEDENENDEEEGKSKNILHSHKTTTFCSKQNNTNTNSATNSSMEDNTITFSSHTCLDDSCKCKNDNVVHSTESANTTTTVDNGNKLSSTNMKFTNNESTYNSSTRNANDKSSLKELSHWSEAEQEQQQEEQEEQETRQEEVGTTKSKNHSWDSNSKVKSKIKEILTLEDVLRCTSMEYNKDNNDNNKEKDSTAKSRNKVLKNLNKLRDVEMHNSTNVESETNKDNNNNNDNNNENQNDEQPIDLSNIDLDDEGSMYVMQRLLDFLQQTMDNSERDMDKDEMDGHTGNVDDDMNKIENNYNSKDKIMCERSKTNTDKSSENYNLHLKRSHYKFHPLENEEIDRAEQINTNEEEDEYEDEYDDEDDDDDDDVNDIYFSSLGLHNKRNIRSNPWESQRTLNSPLEKEVHFTYQTNTSKRDNSNFFNEEEEDNTDFDVEQAHNIQEVNSSNTNKGGRSNTNNNKSSNYCGTSAAEAEDMRALLSAIRHRHYTSFAHKSNDGFDDDDDKLNYLNDKLTANNYVKSKSDVKYNLETEVAAGTTTTKAKVSSSPFCGDESDAFATATQLLSGASKTNINHATSRQGSKMKFSGEQYFCLRNEAAFNPCSSTSIDFSNDPKRSITTTTSTSSKARFTPAALPEDWTAQLASYFADDSFTVASSTSALDVLMNEPAERSTRHCKSKKQGKECKSSVFDIINMNAASSNTSNINNKNRERSLEHSNEYEEETNAAYTTQQAEKNVKNSKCQTSIQNDNVLQDSSVHYDLHNVEKESQNKIDKTSNEQQEENDDDNNNNEVTASESDNHFRVRKRTRSTMMMQQRTISELREKMSILSLFSKETLQRLARQVHKVELPRDLLLNFMPLSLEDSSVAMVAYRLCEAGKAVAASLWWYKEMKSIITPTSSSKSSLEKFDGNNAAQAVTSLASSQTRLTEEKRLELQSILHVNYNKLHSALRLLSCDGLKMLISLLPQLGLITNEDVYGMVNTIAAILFFHTLPPSLLQEICAELAISTSDEANMD